MTEIMETDESDAQIASLEKRVRDLDVMVRALIEEMLDFRAVANTMSKQTEWINRREYLADPIEDTASPAITGPSEENTVIQPKESRQPDAPAEPAMVRIMQADGTMKFEVRNGDKNSIDGAKGYGRDKKSFR